jgi:hypothetical protein
VPHAGRGLKAAGLTVADRLDEITRTYGVYETDQLAVRVADLSLIAEAMVRLRARPPVELLGQPVTVVDLATGSPDLPPTDGVLITGESIKVVVRPSGTEPEAEVLSRGQKPVTSADDLVAIVAARGTALSPSAPRCRSRSACPPADRPAASDRSTTASSASTDLRVLPEVQSIAGVDRLKLVRRQQIDQGGQRDPDLDRATTPPRLRSCPVVYSNVGSMTTGIADARRTKNFSSDSVDPHHCSSRSAIHRIYCRHLLITRKTRRADGRACGRSTVRSPRDPGPARADRRHESWSSI